MYSNHWRKLNTTTMSEREVALRSWENVEDVAIIKNVATKGKYINMCIDYLAKRRKFTTQESQNYFHSIVETYVNRLLHDNLLFKAEDILKNVGRNYKLYYYQRAFDATKDSVREAIINHLEKKSPETFKEELAIMQTYYNFLKDIKENSAKFQDDVITIGTMTLENLFKTTEDFRKVLAVKAYFISRNETYISMLEKSLVWNYVVEERIFEEMVFWVNTFTQQEFNLSLEVEYCSTLNERYLTWPIDSTMIQKALETITDPPDVVRNAFLLLGHVFPDEQDDVRKILNRLFTTESLEANKKLLEKLPITKTLFQSQKYSVLLEEFIPRNEISELKTSVENVVPEDVDLILNLKSVGEQDSLVSLSEMVSEYLEKSIDGGFYSKKPIVLLLQEVLMKNCNHLESIKNGNEMNLPMLNKIPYMKSLIERLKNPESKSSITLNQLLKKFKDIDLDAIQQEIGDEPLTFSNKNLSQKYSRKIKPSYLMYLKQKRSAYAVYYLLMSQLTGFSQISTRHLHTAARISMELAISKYRDQEQVAHCVAFIEMLGFDSKLLRSYISLLRMCDEGKNPETINPANCGEVIAFCERSIVKHMKNNFPIRCYTAIRCIANCVPVNPKPVIVLKTFGEQNCYWELLVLCHYFEFTLKEVKEISEYFASPEMGENFRRALLYETTVHKPNRRASFSRNEHKKKFRPRVNSNSYTTSGETVALLTGGTIEPNKPINSHSSSKFIQHSPDLDIFAIILLSTSSRPEERILSFEDFITIMQDSNIHSTSVNLMKNSIRYKLPVLAILATIICDYNIEWCWILWLLVKIDSFPSTVQSFETFVFETMEYCVRNGFIRALHNSFLVFYEDSKFTYLTNCLLQTMELDFGDEPINNLKKYLVALSNNEIKFKFLPEMEASMTDIKFFTIKLQILHLQHNFSSAYHQKLFLDVLCQAEMNDVAESVDFYLLRNVFEIVMFTNVNINFENIPIHDDLDPESCEEYKRVCKELQESKNFEKAIELASLLNMEKDAIIYEKWIYSTENAIDVFNLEVYEKETDEHGLSPELLVRFYLYIAYNMSDDDDKRYVVFKQALEIIKKNRLFPNEDFDRDRIEYEMIVCYIKGSKSIDEIDVYHSEYFEQVFLKERCVLNKTFLELKELAGVEDLNISNRIDLSHNEKSKLGILLNKLLDEGDIVEALRLQAIFTFRPLDLHFIVFSMALAEKLTNIYNLSESERSTLSDVVKTSISKFRRRTLHRVRRSSSTSSSPTKLNDSSDTNSTLEFEEIPSREKQDILEALQGLASRLEHGVNIGKRIVMTYRSAMYLDREYVDVLKMKEPKVLLKSAIEENCLQKLVVVNDIFISNQMSKVEIAEFLASEIVIAIIRPRFYIFRNEQSNTNPKVSNVDMLWGFVLDKDFHLILDLSTNTTFLGNTLLNYIDALKTYRKYQDNKDYEADFEENPQLCEIFESLRNIITDYGHPVPRHGTNQVLSHKKQNVITVELLILAHRCFVHECSMEGIVNVLTRAKALNSVLATAKSWNVIVRMLTGIGRYREMYYCFETLMQNGQFESLLSRSEKERSSGFRHAVISYLREKYPENTENLRMACISFLMYKELAVMWEAEAKQLTDTLLNPNRETQDKIVTSTPKSSEDVKFLISSESAAQLSKIMGCYVNATESYLLDNKLLLAQKNASMAELIAMQIDLVNKQLKNSPPSTTCLRILNVTSTESFRNLVNKELSVPQAIILGRAYAFEINWADAIFQRYILQDNSEYINEYCLRMELSDSLIEDIAKNFQTQPDVTIKMEDNMLTLVEQVQSVTVKYKLASILGFRKTLMDMINDENCLYFLKDTNYGRNDSSFGCS